jgi:hypothetical protein
MNYKNEVNQSFNVFMKKRKFETPMVEYVKTVLSKVSFDKHLFEKELFKAMALLLPGEILELKNWCYSNYSQDLLSVLNKAF